MTDQQRFVIAALGNSHYTPFGSPGTGESAFRHTQRAQFALPRATIPTGCEPPTTRVFTNVKADPVAGQPFEMEARCGPYLARVMSRLGYRTFESESSTRIHGMKT
jgi:hypothetical protein